MRCGAKESGNREGMMKMKKQKIYAWVTAECCINQHAVRPGTEIRGRAVSSHGDYNRWPHGKRETLRLIQDGPSARTRKEARMVAELMGWWGKQ